MATQPLSLGHFSRILSVVEQVREERGGALESVEQLLAAYSTEERAAMRDFTDETYSDEVPCAA